MGVGTMIASISSIVLTVLAAIGWVIFIGGFGANNTERRFFELVNAFPPETRELLYAPVNAHYIVAVISPILFIVMIVMSVMAMVFKNKLGPYISAILTAFIIILAAFVMISSGVVLYLYSNVITAVRLSSNPSTQSLSLGFLFFTAFQSLGGTGATIYTMFAGMLLEVLFLTGALIPTFIGAILAALDQGKSVD